MNGKGVEIAYMTSEISTGIAMVDMEVNRNYLANLTTHNVIPLTLAKEKKLVPSVTSGMFRFVQITRIVSDKEENFNEKLACIYSSLYTFFSSTEIVDGAIIMLICGKPDKVDYYLGIRHKFNPGIALNLLFCSLEGHFQGSEVKSLSTNEIKTLLDIYLPENESQKKVSSVYAVPSLKTEKDENFVQGVENFIDTMAGKEYTALIISTPISKMEIEQRKRGLENIYTELSKFSEININSGKNESISVAEGTSLSVTNTFGESVSEARGYSYNESKGGQSFFGNYSSGSSTTNSTTNSQNTSEAKGKTASETITGTIGNNSSISVTVQAKTIQEMMKKIDQRLERINKGEAYGLWESACYFIANEQETSIMAANAYSSLLIGENTNTDNSIINYWSSKATETEHLMAYLHNSIHPIFSRMKEIWDMGKEVERYLDKVSNMVNGQELPILMGLPQKSVSGLTSISFATFGRNVREAKTIEYDNERKLKHKDERKINLACIYHMGKDLKEARVVLTPNEFTKHCFVTGSTGSGKSNTVYKLLEEFMNCKGTVVKDYKEYDGKVNFLVIEPAKGEYKKAFGKLVQEKKLNIFTTNAKIHSLLKLNPFAFPNDYDNDIHVLEHLDRLIEIFSACWPLYAAMPAVLKESFEKAYERVGWDLQNSIFIGEGASEGKKKYPSFKTVCEILPEILENSKFSAENKGNYEGALVTRVNSLTNGIMGTIFSAEDEISDKKLFDENTIVDISRVGSSETKSLIMGVLILKLNEYRMSKSEGSNLPLRHITVLEEAHNILKCTSTDQSQEGANLAGKSVEMISNSIAEMRTYGEGFIIVDQSPAMVAQSAITNTNTKIVMRLADYGDCETVGRSVSLNDAQILEISRLNQGVAVIHQSSWTEAVLAKIDKNTAEDEHGQEKPVINNFLPLKKLRGNLITAIFEQRNVNHEELEKEIRKTPRISPETEETYIKLIKNIAKISDSEDLFSELMVNILDCKGMIRACVPKKISPLVEKKIKRGTHDVEAKKWLSQIEQSLKNYVDTNDKLLKKMVYYIVHWIDMQRKQKSKEFNLNIFDASKITSYYMSKPESIIAKYFNYYE